MSHCLNVLWLSSTAADNSIQQVIQREIRGLIPIPRPLAYFVHFFAGRLLLRPLAEFLPAEFALAECQPQAKEKLSVAEIQIGYVMDSFQPVGKRIAVNI